MQRRMMWAAVTVAVFATAVSAQTPQQSAVMPGTPVGTPSVQPIGSRLPSVGTQPPRVGQPLQSGKLPASPFVGDGWPKVDPNLVVAPYPTPPSTSNSFWDKLYQRWMHIFVDDTRPNPTYTPGISRRNRERREKREEEMRRMRD